MVNLKKHKLDSIENFLLAMLAIGFAVIAIGGFVIALTPIVYGGLCWLLALVFSYTAPTPIEHGWRMFFWGMCTFWAIGWLSFILSEHVVWGPTLNNKK